MYFNLLTIRRSKNIYGHYTQFPNKGSVINTYTPRIYSIYFKFGITPVEYTYCMFCRGMEKKNKKKKNNKSSFKWGVFT